MTLIKKLADWPPNYKKHSENVSPNLLHPPILMNNLTRNEPTIKRRQHGEAGITAHQYGMVIEHSGKERITLVSIPTMGGVSLIPGELVFQGSK